MSKNDKKIEIGCWGMIVISIAVIIIMNSISNWYNKNPKSMVICLCVLCVALVIMYFIAKSHFDNKISDAKKDCLRQINEAHKKNEVIIKDIQNNCNRQIKEMSDECNKKIIEITKKNNTIVIERKRLIEETAIKTNALTNENDTLRACIKQKDDLYSELQKHGNEGIYHISELMSDFLTLQYQISEQYLKSKTRPAIMEAERIADLKRTTKEIIKQNKIILYKYEYLLRLFPELEYYADSFESLKELLNFNNIKQVQEEHDAVVDYLSSKEEYQKLSETERNQKALDNYVRSKKKSLWFIGRDYELYCGYLLRQDGYSVKQNGIEKKLEDLGRDIIATKIDSSGNQETLIVQCKLWSNEKIIHEKHIAQLYGTKVMYEIDHANDLFNNRVIGVFMTNIDFSEEAQKFAKKLGIVLRKQPMSDNFPRIKCNINGGNKIYHLPFDQQYDAAMIKLPGEFYAYTVKEAEKAGFKRALRWHGNN